MLHARVTMVILVLLQLILNIFDSSASLQNSNLTLTPPLVSSPGTISYAKQHTPWNLILNIYSQFIPNFGKKIRTQLRPFGVILL